MINLKLRGLNNIQKAFAELRRTLEINKNNRLKISELYHEPH